MINLRFELFVLLVAGFALSCTSAPSPTETTGPSAVTTAAASPTISSPPPSSATDPDMTQTFVSAHSGYSIRYPAGSTTEEAAEPWSPDSTDNAGFDFIRGLGGVLRGGSIMAPDGVSIDGWIDESITGATVGDCNAPRTTLPEIIIDGHVGRVRDACPDEVEATVVVGRRVYLFTLFNDQPNARALFDAFAATIDLRPEDARADPSPKPS